MARNLLWESPTEAVTPISASMRFCRRAIWAAGERPVRRRVPLRSRKASSSESGSTSGVSASIIARIARETSKYRAMRGLMTTASGQSLSALNIGMAERTPSMRAM